jgi:hypothetical protein
VGCEHLLVTSVPHSVLYCYWTRSIERVPLITNRVNNLMRKSVPHGNYCPCLHIFPGCGNLTQMTSQLRDFLQAHEFTGELEA